MPARPAGLSMNPRCRCPLGTAEACGIMKGSPFEKPRDIDSVESRATCAMRRRLFMAVLCSVATRPASVLGAGRTYRVGLLALRSGLDSAKALLETLAQRGYIERNNLIVITKSADGQVDRLPGLARDLISSGVDAIVSFGSPAAVAAKQSTSTVPIIVTGTGDPV